MSGFVECDDFPVPVHVPYQFAQGRGATVVQRRCRRFDHECGRRALVNLNTLLVRRRSVFEPNRATYAQSGDNLRQQREAEYLPEQTSHRYSRMNW